MCRDVEFSLVHNLAGRVRLVISTGGGLAFQRRIWPPEEPMLWFFPSLASPNQVGTGDTSFNRLPAHGDPPAQFANSWLNATFLQQQTFCDTDLRSYASSSAGAPSFLDSIASPRGECANPPAGQELFFDACQVTPLSQPDHKDHFSGGWPTVDT